MFTIGEFSRFAQVTTDLLRYYDKLDLFKPVHIDKFTGYRYYHIEQLTDLNRIIALKDLGLSLAQIRRVLHDQISTDEIRGMLTLQKFKAEEAIRNEIQRLQQIESRLQYLDNNDAMPQYDIVTKSTIDEHWLSIPRQAYPELTGEEFFEAVHQSFTQLLPSESGHCVCAMNALELETTDWEMGFILKDTRHKQLTIFNNQVMTRSVLKGFELVASVLYNGSMNNFHLAYNALGGWIQNHAYQVIGKTYEIFYQVPDSLGNNTTVEIQMPIRQVS